MSVKGLVEQEKQAKAIYSKIKKSLNRELLGLKDEIKKVEFLLGDSKSSAAWAAQLADDSRRAQLLKGMSDVEQLYLTAGDSQAAKIFKQRMERQLRGKLTNLKATQLELKTRLAKSKQEVQTQLLDGLTDVKREGALREMYDQARGNGGFFANFGRPYLNDLVTLKTKSAGSKTIGEYMKNLYNQYESKLTDVLIHGIVRGDSYDMMERGLKDATDITAGKAKLLVRTEANAIFNESVREVIDDNPLVKGYMFRAVLDAKTSKICQEHDGEYIPKEDVKPGVNYPPLHPNCRSTVTTVLVDEDEKQDTMQRYTKNGKNQWEKVPVGMNYQEYKDKFGFSNSKNPKTYNAETRDIHDATLARVTVNKYKGYVKPSASSTSRIDKLVKSYVGGDKEMLEAVRENTGMDSNIQAIMRQAQAESGFDGLPLQLTERQFDKQVEDKGLVKVYRKFGKQEDLDSFLEGDQAYLKVGQDVHGTKVFMEKPEDMTGVVEMALKSSDNKILKVANRDSIRQGLTGDSRIDRILRTTPESKRSGVFSALSIEYGYDGVQFQDDKAISVLNRTAVVVKQRPEIEVPDVTVRQPVFSSTVERLDSISSNDARIVNGGGTRIVPGKIASAAQLDHNLEGTTAKARAIYKAQYEAEKDITKTVLDIADKTEGSRMEGLENNVKTASSVKGKIARKRQADKDSGLPIKTDEEYVKSMTDIVRYTEVVKEPDVLVKATNDAIDEFQARGLEVIEVDNKYIDGDGSYKGIHLLVEDKNGVIFEYQVHSEESLATKSINHKLYEQSRKPKTPDDIKKQLEMQMIENASKLRTPKDIEKLKSFYRKKR